MLNLPDFPILVGVTGHRDILPQAMPDVRQATRAALGALHAAFPAQLLLMTALAEGADQLVAEVAQELGIGLIAVAPMPFDRYRTTIEDPASALALDRLWQSPAVVQRIELPMLDRPEPSDAGQYEQLGLLLSRRSHILLALWNGDDPEPAGQSNGKPRQTRGGTPHVVAVRLSGERNETATEVIQQGALFEAVQFRLDSARSGPILQVVTPRKKDGGSASLGGDGVAHSAGTLLWWSDDFPASVQAGYLCRVLSSIWPAGKPHENKTALWTCITADTLASRIPADLNRVGALNELLSQGAAHRARLASSDSSYLCNDVDLAQLGGTSALRHLRDVFDAADADASAIQRRLFGAWLPGLPWPKTVANWARGTPIGALLLFAAAVPMATICFEIFTELGHNPVWLAAYATALVVPLVFYIFLVRPGEWQERYQDHRALAEGLRVQFFWAVAGLRVAVADSYLRYQRGTLGWIRLALQGPALLAIAAADGRTPELAGLRRLWIADQAKYFANEGKRQLAAAMWMRRGAGVAIALLFAVAAILLAAVAALGGHYPHTHPEYLAELPLVALGTLPAIAAFFLIIAEGRAYEEHAHAYAQSNDVFTEADRQASLLQSGDTRILHALVLALGHEALTENATWIATHRNRRVASRIG